MKIIALIFVSQNLKNIFMKITIVFIIVMMMKFINLNIIINAIKNAQMELILLIKYIYA